eukprot:TRINITY_DN27123_c0_g1_i2.p1 TRINITY_DN27123_c0_g1~~TRINITY_DN27123_c0_g1_i2.p1  ORF type:complete len:482 (+),score=77.70 TRINITY_DN27123_c0_g1_i2:75-1520(+)
MRAGVRRLNGVGEGQPRLRLAVGASVALAAAAYLSRGLVAGRYAKAGGLRRADPTPSPAAGLPEIPSPAPGPWAAPAGRWRGAARGAGCGLGSDSAALSDAIAGATLRTSCSATNSSSGSVFAARPAAALAAEGGPLQRVAAAAAAAPRQQSVYVGPRDAATAAWLARLVARRRPDEGAPDPDEGVLHLVEPDPWRARALRRAASSLPVPVSVHPVGAGDQERPFAFWSGPAGSFVRGEGAEQGPVAVRMRRLDNLVRGGPLRLVAVSAPRHEARVLRGARDVLSRTSAVVVELTQSPDSRAVVPLLGGLGFAVFALGCTGVARLRPDRPYWWGSVLAVRPSLGAGGSAHGTRVSDAFLTYGAGEASPWLVAAVRAVALTVIACTALAVIWTLGVPLVCGLLGFTPPPRTPPGEARSPTTAPIESRSPQLGDRVPFSAQLPPAATADAPAAVRSPRAQAGARSETPLSGRTPSAATPSRPP